jgi:hypothetical protein
LQAATRKDPKRLEKTRKQRSVLVAAKMLRVFQLREKPVCVGEHVYAFVLLFVFKFERERFGSYYWFYLKTLRGLVKMGATCR